MTLGAMLASDATLTVRARCLQCGQHGNVDIHDLAGRMGHDYSLWHRRTRCRLTPGCSGWNVFSYSTGTWFWHMYDDADELRWMLG